MCLYQVPIGWRLDGISWYSLMHPPVSWPGTIWLSPFGQWQLRIAVFMVESTSTVQSVWLHNVLVLAQFKFEAWIITLWSPVPQPISSRNHDLMMPSASTNYFKLWPHLCQTSRYHDARSHQPISSQYCEKTIENHQIPSTTPILSRI